MRNFFLIATIISVMTETVLAAGGTVIGNGGDVVFCQVSATNNLSGYYSLDYLLTLDSKSPTIKVTSWQQSLFEIRRVLADKLPEVLRSFDEFQQNILNRDYTKPQIWEQTALSLTPIHDEDLHSAIRVPENCRQGDQINIIQTVVRQFKGFSGTNKIVYKYVPEVFELLASERPLQLSFLLIHEWLWSISDNVDRNRRVARFFHSEEFYRLDRQNLLSQFQGMGLQILELPLVVAADGSGDFTTIEEAVMRARPNVVIQVKEGEYFTRGVVISKSLQLIGVGDRNKIILRGTPTVPALVISTAPTDTVKVENLSFIRPYYNDFTPFDGTLVINRGSPLISGCRFGVAEPIVTGILVAGKQATPTVINNEFGNDMQPIFIGEGAGHYKNNFYRGHCGITGSTKDPRLVIEESQCPGESSPTP